MDWLEAHPSLRRMGMIFPSYYCHCSYDKFNTKKTVLVFDMPDIHRTELCQLNSLPRFIMPLELGMLLLDAKKFGRDEQKKKICVIFDSEKYRYQKFISDLSGQDIKSHNTDPLILVKAIRNWLQTASGRKTLPGGNAICRRYSEFIIALPKLCKQADVDYADLIYNDYTTFVTT